MLLYTGLCVCVCLPTFVCMYVCVWGGLLAGECGWDGEAMEMCVKCVRLHTQYLTNLAFFLVDSNLAGAVESSASFPGESRCCLLNHSPALCSVLEGLPPALEWLEGKSFIITNWYIKGSQTYHITVICCMHVTSLQCVACVLQL